MKRAEGLALNVLKHYLESYSSKGLPPSIKNLSRRAKVSEKTIGEVLSLLERKGYLIKSKSTGEYVLTKKLLAFI